MTAALLRQALALAASGLTVFPCTSAKAPAIPKARGGRGYLDASRDPATIIRLFARAPGAQLIGVPTGAISGFDVLDSDPRHGGDRWEAANPIPETRVHQTRSGGRHHLFRHAPGVGCSQHQVGPGIDVRGDGGYIVHPPSAGYRIISDAPLIEWPRWLLPLALKPPCPSPVRTATPLTHPIENRRIAGFIRCQLGRLSAAPDGQKHWTLLRTARAIGGVLEAGGITDTEAIAMLTGALPVSVRDWKAAAKTAAAGIAHGRAQPIHLEDRPR